MEADLTGDMQANDFEIARFEMQRRRVNEFVDRSIREFRGYNQTFDFIRQQIRSKLVNDFQVEDPQQQAQAEQSFVLETGECEFKVNGKALMSDQ